MFDIISDALNRVTSSATIVLSLSATAIAGFTLNDIAMLVGMIGTAILAIFNARKNKREREAHARLIDQYERDKAKIALETEKLTLEIEILRKRSNDTD